MKHHPWDGPANNRQGPGTVKGKEIAFLACFQGIFSRRKMHGKRQEASERQAEKNFRPMGNQGK